MLLNIQRTGLIIKTRRTEECVRFYREVLKLETLFEGPSLTCFGVGGSYLMIEPNPQGILEGQSELLVLRLNVPDVLAAREELGSQGVESFYSKFDWGEILTFHDPAGTKIELKDSAGFEGQLRPT